MRGTHTFRDSQETADVKMTKAEINKNWETVLDLLAENVTSVSMQTWFAPLKPIRVNKKEVRILL